MLKGIKDQTLFVYKLRFHATKKGKVKRKTSKPKQNFRATVHSPHGSIERTHNLEKEQRRRKAKSKETSILSHFSRFFFTDEMLVQYLSKVQQFAAWLVASWEGQPCTDIQS